MGVAIMKSTDSEVRVRRLEPAPGLHLRNIETGEVFEGLIYLAKSQTADDFEEITQEEYDRIVQEQIDAYNAQFINEGAVGNDQEEIPASD